MISSLGSNSVVTVTGLSTPSDTIEEQKSWTTDVKITGMNCYIEQMDAKNTMIFAGKATARMFLLLSTEVVDIVEGDQITDNHGRTFKANAVQKFVGDPDVPDHIEVNMLQNYST